MDDTSANLPRVRVAPSGALTTSAVERLLSELRAAFASAGAVELASDEVSQISQAGLQLLASAVRTGRERGVPVRLSGTAGIEAAIRLAGLGDLLVEDDAMIGARS